MGDYKDQIAMMLKCHLISIFLAIYFLNIGDETFALKITVQDQHPEICQAKNHITCKIDIDCNAHEKTIEWKPRHEKRKGVCKNIRNSHEKHCICRRDGCDHGDMCEKNSDCGRDQWNRRGKCVTDYKMKHENYGPWKLHKHCECLPPFFPENCQGQKDACTNNKQCGQYGSCNRKDKLGAGTGRICTCRRKTCNSGDICFKDSDCGFLEPLGSGKRGTCEKVPASYPFRYKKVCKCPLSPEFDLKEAVDQNLQTAKENQKIVKEGKKWLKTLYEALKEKHPHRSYEKEDEVDDDDNDNKNRNYVNDDDDDDDDDHDDGLGLSSYEDEDDGMIGDEDESFEDEGEYNDDEDDSEMATESSGYNTIPS